MTDSTNHEEEDASRSAAYEDAVKQVKAHCDQYSGARTAELTFLLKRAYINRPLYCQIKLLSLLIEDSGDRFPSTFEITDRQNPSRSWKQGIKVYDAGKTYLVAQGWIRFTADNKLVEGDTIYLTRAPNGLCLQRIVRGNGSGTKSKPKAEPVKVAIKDKEEAVVETTQDDTIEVEVDTRLPSDRVVVADVTRGSEIVQVPAVNGVDDEKPPDFVYVHQAVTGLGVSLRSNPKELAPCCKCVGVCKPNCECTVAYDKGGLLLTKRPRGPGFPGLPWRRLRSEVVFECSYRCRCGPECHNRVVQHGIRHQLEVFRTKYKGWGLRAAEPILEGSFVCEYIGELISCSEAETRGRDIENGDAYLYDLDLLEEENVSTGEMDVDTSRIVVVDARTFGSVARFANHACGPRDGCAVEPDHPCNMTKVSVFVGHRDPLQPRLCLFAQRDISPGEELCYDYEYLIGSKFDPVTHEEVAIPCHCDSPHCRKRLV